MLEQIPTAEKKRMTVDTYCAQVCYSYTRTAEARRITSTAIGRRKLRPILTGKCAQLLLMIMIKPLSAKPLAQLSVRLLGKIRMRGQ